MSNFDMENDLDYVESMDEDERVVFIQTLVRLALSDGELDKEEKTFVEDLAVVFRVPKERFKELKTKISDDELVEKVSIIQDRAKAMELIKEMCILANSDGNLDDNEIILIGRVGEAMGLELEKIEQISQWVVDRIIWEEEGRIIFEQV